MRDGRHIPALDGVRGLALVAILTYHANPAWLPGAPLSVTVFFTLSGFLITSLLLREGMTTGRIDLRSFWTRRLRRLVPASIAGAVLVAVLVAAGALAITPTLVGDATSALSWTANWRFIASGTSYESLFADPSPFQHFWSLAVEEQLYLVLPVVAVLLLGSGARHRVRFGVVVGVAIVASTVTAIVLANGGGIAGRAYYGTDARIAEPLVGVLLAVLVTRADGFVRLDRAWTRIVEAAGCLALGGLVAMLLELSVSDPRLYRGGFLLGALLAAVVVFAATQDTVVTRLFEAPPLVGLGLISYATYIFHWPVFQWIDPRGTHEPRLLVLELAITLALAIASTSLLENPIRRRRAQGAPVFAVGWANATVAALAMVVVATTLPVRVTDAAPVDLGLGVDDPVPAPPVAVGGAAAAPEAAPQGSTGGAVTGEQAMPAPAPGTDEQAPTPEPVTPEEAAILTGDDWANGDVDDQPSGTDGTELRVAVVGDSLAHNIASGLETWAAERGDVLVYDLSVSFCPLSRGGERRWEYGSSFEVNEGCGWWDQPWSERATAFTSFAPDVVVHTAPFSEMLDRKLPEWPEWRRPGDGEYHGWLIDEYTTMFDTMRGMATETVRFLSLNAPCGDWTRPRGWRRVTDPDGRMEAMNQGVYPLLVQSAQGDLFSQLCPDGEYEDDLWGYEDARPDGIHISDEASAHLAREWLGPLVLQTAGRPDNPDLLGPPPGT